MAEEIIKPRDLVGDSRLNERKNIHFPEGTADACARLVAADKKASFPDWVRSLVQTELKDRDPDAYRALKGVA